MRVVLMGPPGVGKGTQAKRLAEQMGLAHLSSGDLFRAERAAAGPWSRQLAQYMDAGRLVPDDLVVQVMSRAIAAHNGSAGVLLDGFPRTVAQAEALEAELAGSTGPGVDTVLVITASEESIVKRIAGRRSCPKCGRVYNVETLPPRRKDLCDACLRPLVRREDDTEDVVVRRLAGYREQTEPVIAYYRGRPSTRVIEVNGDRRVEEVTAALTAALRADAKN